LRRHDDRGHALVQASLQDDRQFATESVAWRNHDPIRRFDRATFSPVAFALSELWFQTIIS
jgi:hypothetical protein